MNTYQIQITNRACFDIFECVSFLSFISKEAADKLHTEIIESIYSLSSFPNRYPEIEDFKILGYKVRKMTIQNGRYLILYRVKVETVIVYDVIDCRKETALTNAIQYCKEE